MTIKQDALYELSSSSLLIHQHTGLLLFTAEGNPACSIQKNTNSTAAGFIFSIETGTLPHTDNPFLFPACSPPPCSYLADWAARWREQLQRRIPGARLAEPQLWEEKKEKSILWWTRLSQKQRGCTGDSAARPSKTNRKASPSSPRQPFHALTMVAMAAIFQFITVSTCPGCVKSDTFLCQLHL